MASGEGANTVVGVEGGSWHSFGLTFLCLQEASLRLRCDASDREHVLRGDEDEGGARAVAARRGLASFFEWCDSADLHHW